MKPENTAFFLDFDGVICDSIRECFVSSWCAFHRCRGVELPVSIPLAYWNTFRAFRPYIRSGEDYLLIHELLQDRVHAGNQEEFDRIRAGRGARLAEYKRALQAERERFLSFERTWWLELHTLYPGLEPLLRKAAGDPRFHILSTKRAALISEILSFCSIPWPLERIHYSGDEDKLSFIREIAGKEKAERSVFIDDQKDHFSGNTDGTIRCLLASWGYVQPEWLSAGDTEVLDLEGCLSMLRAGLG